MKMEKSEHPKLSPLPGRYLHIIPDDKFIDAVYGIFEEIKPGSHDYLNISTHPGFRYIKDFYQIKISSTSQISKQTLSNINQYSIVFIHYLSLEARAIIEKAPCNTKFIWLGWGADYYHLIKSKDELWLPVTGEIMRLLLTRRPNQSPLTRIKRHLKFVLTPKRILNHLKKTRYTRKIGPLGSDETSLLNRFHSMSTPIKEDYDAIVAKHADINIPFLDWNYWIKDFNAYEISPHRGENNILLGNSATPENNHIEALESIAPYLPSDYKIICPLNYGDSSYADEVERRARVILGNRFFAIRIFMDSHDYINLLSSCSAIIMNHVRQQALGNILISLCAGAHVYLNTENPINVAMRRIGIQTRQLNQFFEDISKENFNTIPENLNETRNIIDSHYGRATILKKTSQILLS